MEIDKKTLKDVQSFIVGLTGADNSEAGCYLSEIISDNELHESLAKTREARSGAKFFSFDILGIDVTSCLILYALCRKLKPAVMVETGVASGVSASYVLNALNRNKRGTLFSIDVPWQTVKQNWRKYFSEEAMVSQPIEEKSGWIIPNYLRDRWQLVIGKSSDALPPLLLKTGPIDIFFHDSEHVYDTMSWEFRTAWAGLKKGGLLVAHNIDSNSAFADFEKIAGGNNVQLVAKHNNADRTQIIAGKVKF